MRCSILFVAVVAMIQDDATLRLDTRDSMSREDKVQMAVDALGDLDWNQRRPLMWEPADPQANPEALLEAAEMSDISTKASQPGMEAEAKSVTEDLARDSENSAKTVAEDTNSAAFSAMFPGGNVSETVKAKASTSTDALINAIASGSRDVAAVDQTAATPTSNVTNTNVSEPASQAAEVANGSIPFGSGMTTMGNMLSGPSSLLSLSPAVSPIRHLKAYERKRHLLWDALSAGMTISSSDAPVSRSLSLIEFANETGTHYAMFAMLPVAVIGMAMLVVLTTEGSAKPKKKLVD